jgi:hypothetical protein
MAMGAFSHLLMAAYSLSLPASRREASLPPATLSLEGATPAKASRLGLLRNRPLVLFLLVSLLASIPSQPYNLANAFMNQQGYGSAAATLTLGQITEVTCMALMPMLARRFRLKTLFLVGLLGWATRYTLLAVGTDAHAAGSPLQLLVFLAILLHGPSYVFVYIAGQMYVDRLVDRRSRGVAQGLHALATSGFGHLTGALVTSWSQAALLTPSGVSPAPYNWTPFWLIPVVFGLAVAGLFAALFSDKSPPRAADGRAG